MARAKRRDPRVNPATGDILLGGMKQVNPRCPVEPTSRRRVHGISEMKLKEKSVEWVRYEETMDLKMKLDVASTSLGSCSLEEWQSWSKAASVVVKAS